MQMPQRLQAPPKPYLPPALLTLFFLNKIAVPPTSENRILNCGFTKDNIHKVYSLPFTVTKQTKLIAFQYKIIHNVLPNQINLFHAGKADKGPTI